MIFPVAVFVVAAMPLPQQAKRPIGVKPSAKNSRPAPKAAEPVFVTGTARRDFPLLAKPTPDSAVLEVYRQGDSVRAKVRKGSDWLAVMLPKGRVGYVPPGDVVLPLKNPSKKTLAAEAVLNLVVVAETPSRAAMEARKQIVAMGPRVLPVLFFELRKPDEFGMPRGDLADVIAEFGESGKSAILAALENENPIFRNGAALVLQHTIERLIEAEEDLEADADADVRIKNRVHRLKYVRSDEISDLLRRLIQDEVCLAPAAITLGLLNDRAAVADLLQIVAKKDVSMAADAFAGLLNYGDAISPPKLRAAFDQIYDTIEERGGDREPESLRDLVDQFILGTTQTARELLIDLLDHTDARLRANACHAIEGRRDPLEMPHVLPMLKDPEASVRRSALSAVATLGRDRYLSDIVTFTKSFDAEDRKAGLLALASTKSAEALSPILELVADPDPQVRTAVVRSLRSFRDPRSKEALAKLVEDADSTVKSMAQEALAEYPSDPPPFR